MGSMVGRFPAVSVSGSWRLGTLPALERGGPHRSRLVGVGGGTEAAAARRDGQVPIQLRYQRHACMPDTHH
jgi:hypothetical protein